QRVSRCCSWRCRANTGRSPASYRAQRRVAERERREFLIVGGGPAGLSAALEATRAGVDVCVVDVRPELGGRTPRGPVTRRLVRDVLARTVEVRIVTSQWGCWGR